MSTFVLVHGGWHGGWCWRKVAPPLRAAGHEVHTPTLTGTGERAHLAGPDVDLSTHIQDVRGLLRCEDLTGVVLVGHSSSGAVITGVGAAEPARLRRLVYLDAFVPRAGESVLDLLPEARREFFVGRALGGSVPLDPDVALDGWLVTDPADRDWMRPRLTSQPLGGLSHPLPADPPPELPRTYLHARQGPTVATFAPFAERAASEGWTLRPLDTGHDAMITKPDRVVELLSEAALSA